ASDESTFSDVPGPSGATPVASAAPAASPSAPQELPSTPPPEELPSSPPPAEQPAPAPTKPKATKPAKKPTQPAQAIVTADASVSGKIATYNAVGKFVVVSFAGGKMAQLNQTLSVYHNGTKTGDIRITGPQRDNNIVGDVVSGTVQAGDEVRGE
ncbi:MAG TPA: hypothetical protein VN625_05330, partial [Desulfuromonadaceae bacterium]|nr:hypothetical protein [Desulfuromonadaceae bacterium]